MELMVERGRRVSVEELNTTKLLAHARQQAVQRKFDDIVIVDCEDREASEVGVDQAGVAAEERAFGCPREIEGARDLSSIAMWPI